MAAPGSERASWPGCASVRPSASLGVDFERMSMMRLYRVSDALMAQRAAIEAHVRSGDGSVRAALHSDALRPDQHLLRGRSGGPAQGRTRPLQGEALGLPAPDPLVLDGSGFGAAPRCSPARSTEDKTLASMLEALGAPSRAGGDGRLPPRRNIAWLRENGYRYLAVSRERTRRFDPDLAWPSRPGRARRSMCTRRSTPKVERRGSTATPRRGRRRNRASQTASPRDSRAR